LFCIIHSANDLKTIRDWVMKNAPAQDQSRVVKIAQGGYMDVLFPKEEVSMDEILRILEGREHG
jgi:uncharacterized protein YozE (UPF0346 family)